MYVVDVSYSLSGPPPRPYRCSHPPWYAHFRPLTDPGVLAADILTISKRLMVGNATQLQAPDCQQTQQQQQQQSLSEQTEPELNYIVTSLLGEVESDFANGSGPMDCQLAGQMPGTAQFSAAVPMVTETSGAALGSAAQRPIPAAVQGGQGSHAQVQTKKGVTPVGRRRTLTHPW